MTMIDLQVQPNENEKQYLWRIGLAIEEGRVNLTWEEFADIMNKNWRKDESEYRSSSAYRKPVQYAVRFYKEVWQPQNSKCDDTEYNDLMVELHKERIKARDERTELNRIIREQARKESFFDLVKNTMQENFPISPIVEDEEYQISNYDNGIIKSSFFADNTSNSFITGGHQEQYKNPDNGILYDYSENVYKYKHGLDYEVYNEIIEKDIKELNRYGVYNNKNMIDHIMVESNSKINSDEKQPPVKINSIILTKSNGEIRKLNLDLGCSWYEWDDEKKENPYSAAVKNEDGSITISYNKRYCAYMIKVDEFDMCEYESIMIDADYIAEYKLYLIPVAEKEHVTANVWDRGRVDDSILIYNVDYHEIFNLCLYGAQQKIKKQESEISVLKSEIQEIKKKKGNA